MTHHRDRPTEISAATEVRALAHAKVLTDLFERRPDLTGVYPPADLAAEAVRWSA
jgi:hypothetical protein